MNAIEVHRKKLGLTQIDLAKEMNVTQANISQWETGEAMPRAEKLPQLAKVLQCEISDLFKSE